MTTKEIIDSHYSDRYNYYRAICLQITNKDDLIYKDLLHDTYEALLKIKEETIIRFNKIDKLHYLGIKTIKQLYGKRFNKKKYTKNLSSPLFIAVDEFIRLDSIRHNDEFNEETNNRLFELEDCNDTEFSEEDYLLLDQAITALLKDPEKTVGVTIFLEVSETNILQLHKDSKISRYFLTSKYKEGIQNIKKYIENEREKNNTITGNPVTHRSESREIPLLDKEKRTIAA